MSPALSAHPKSRAAARQVRELKERLGRQIAGLREEAGVTQAQLARCAGTSQSYLSEIEAGRAEPATAVLVGIGQCLGADLAIRYFPGAGPRIHDRFQAPMIDALIKLLGPSWVAQPEVPVPAARGVIDLVIRERTKQIAIACECHSQLRRLELVMRRIAEKAETLAGQLETPVPVSRLLLLRSTLATRSVARAYEATLRTAFAARAADAVAALRGGRDWPGPAIVWVSLDAGRAVVLDAPPRGVRVGR